MFEYSHKEETANILSHAIGVILSLVAIPLLIMRATEYGNIWHMLSMSIFGGSLLLLYTASTLYHSAEDPKRRSKLKIFDHCAIYVLIAGTYTPFTIITLDSSLGWWLFCLSWGMAVVGVTLKLFFTGKYKYLSTAMYILMGWMIAFAIKPLADSLDVEGLRWLVAGGISYTVGAVFYSIKQIKFNHAIFHIFVLMGSIFHFLSVYFYVLPHR